MENQETNLYNFANHGSWIYCLFSCNIRSYIVEFLFLFLQSLGIVKNVFGPTTIYSDNQAIIVYVKDLKYHGRTKHIDTKNHFISNIIT